MFKHLLIIIAILNLSYANANEKKEEKKYTSSSQYYEKIFKNEKTDLSINAKNLFNNIDKNEALNDYKKYLLNSIATFHILITKDYNNEELLLKHAQNFFPITICFTYQFDKDTSRQIENINSILLNNERLIKQFNTAQTYVFEKYLIEKQNVFFENIEKDFFSKKCSG